MSSFFLLSSLPLRPSLLGHLHSLWLLKSARKVSHCVGLLHISRELRHQRWGIVLGGSTYFSFVVSKHILVSILPRFGRRGNEHASNDGVNKDLRPRVLQAGNKAVVLLLSEACLVSGVEARQNQTGWWLWVEH